MSCGGWGTPTWAHPCISSPLPPCRPTFPSVILNNSPSGYMGSCPKPAFGVIDFPSAPCCGVGDGGGGNGKRGPQSLCVVCTQAHMAMMHGRIKPGLTDYIASEMVPVSHSGQSLSLLGIVGKDWQGEKGRIT